MHIRQRARGDCPHLRRAGGAPGRGEAPQGAAPVEVYISNPDMLWVAAPVPFLLCALLPSGTARVCASTLSSSRSPLKSLVLGVCSGRA